MKSNILLLASAACGTALLWGGCSVTRNTIEPVGVAAQRQVLSDKRLVIDTGLRNRLQPIGINTFTGPGGSLKIQIEMQNTTGSAQKFIYRIEWFDENGMIINTPAAVAIPHSIERGETRVITVMAPTDRAKDFRIEFLKPE